jgi:hypothetical protein
MHPFLRVPLAAALAAALQAAGSGPAQAQNCYCDPCGEGLGFGTPCPNCNVTWQIPDSIAGCPAGDSLEFSHSSTHKHPARLRIFVHYEDNSCNVRTGVPPESIYVTYLASSGNLVVDDQSDKIFADDSTDAGGNTRITVPSFSGCGRMHFELVVSGVQIHGFYITARTTDTNADGRVDSEDANTACDFNYNGTTGDTTEVRLQQSNHDEHWHRNALHGTLVRRTNFCETCPEEAPNTKGDGPVYWSPTGRFIAHSTFKERFLPNDTVCVIQIVPSDPPPTGSNSLTAFTSPPFRYHDYNPTWSPLNDFIVFDRGDSVIMRKPVPWSGSTTETAITSSDNCGAFRGDAFGAISPDGLWVAFARCNGDPTGGWSLWKIRVDGQELTQLTPTTSTAVHYPRWSPDGQTVYFQAKDESIGPGWTLWKIPAEGGTAVELFEAPSSPTYNAVQPSPSPDGKVAVFGFGPEDPVTRTVVTHTLDLGLASPGLDQVVPNYTDTTFAAEPGDFPILAPSLSPDGTRTALGSKQVWAARRNMNAPPRITSVAGNALADTAVSLTLNANEEQQVCFSVAFTDPESDAVADTAFLPEPWMSYNSSSGEVCMTPPPGTQGNIFNIPIVVTTSSGGTDKVILQVEVCPCGSRARSGPALLTEGVTEGTSFGPLGPNPTGGTFAFATPVAKGHRARLTVFDLSGRRVCQVERPAGEVLRWNGTNETGRRVAAGVYLYRVELGNMLREGKIVMAR